MNNKFYSYSVHLELRNSQLSATYMYNQSRRTKVRGSLLLHARSDMLSFENCRNASYLLQR